jgi:hypothetical protein
MSTLIHSIGRLFAALFTTPSAPLDPEAMSLHDWADLPSHHPVADRAPC